MNKFYTTTFLSYSGNFFMLLRRAIQFFSSFRQKVNQGFSPLNWDLATLFRRNQHRVYYGLDQLPVKNS